MGRAKLFAVVVSVAAVGASMARATEPDAKAVACLASVLRSAPDAVSVTPAKDIAQHFYHSRRLPGVSRAVTTVARGVNYAFRKPGGAVMTIGVYLSTQNEVERDDYCLHDPNCFGVAPNFVPSNNGRFSIWLQPPYPLEWYPLAKPAYVSANETRYLKQDSPEHPLFKLWYRLASKCKADNLNINSGVVP